MTTIGTDLGSRLQPAPRDTRVATDFSRLLGSSTGTTSTTGPEPTSGPPIVAQARPIDTITAAGRALVPDAAAFGVTTPKAPVGVPGFLAPAGNFALYGLENGNWSYFGARPLQALPSIPTPWGPIRQGLSLVGTAGQAGDGSLTDQAGMGWTAKVPSPYGDILLFANARQDAGTLGNAFQERGRHVVSVNFGAVYSVSDAAVRALAAKNPAIGIPAAGLADASGADVWAGFGYSTVPIQMVIEDGAPTSFIINGNEIPIEQISALFGDEIENRTMRGGYVPQELNNSVLRDFDPRYTNLLQEGSSYGAVIERALDRDLIDPAQQYDLMREALAQPDRVFSGLPPEGRKAALLIINAALGRTGEANRIAAELFPYDNTVDGVRPRGLESLRIDALSELDAAHSGGERVSQGYVGVPGKGQALLQYDPRAGLYSLHGRNGAQHPLPDATSLEEAREQARALIAGGGFSHQNLHPLAASIPDDQPTRISQGYAGVPGLGQLEVRWDSRTGDYSAHGANNAQYPLTGVTTLNEAKERVRGMIAGGGVSAGNLFPLAGPPVANIPADQPTRISQGYAGVPGLGQLEVRWDNRTGDYSAHGANNAQYPLTGVTTLDEAKERVRGMIAGGGVSAGNLFPLAGPPVANIPADQPTRISQGYAGVPGVGQLEIRWDSRTGAYSAHGPNNAQYALEGVQTHTDAKERVRELIRNGAVSPQNLFPL